MKTLILVTSLSLLWCSSPRPAPSPEPDTHVLTCADACKNLRELGCAEAAPTDAGATCEEVCTNAGDLPVACITRATTCEATESCE